MNQEELLETETKSVKPPREWDWFTCRWTAAGAVLFFVSLITSSVLTYIHTTKVEEGCINYRTTNSHWTKCEIKEKVRPKKRR